jgi:hypothetical protein
VLKITILGIVRLIEKIKQNRREFRVISTGGMGKAL